MDWTSEMAARRRRLASCPRALPSGNAVVRSLRSTSRAAAGQRVGRAELLESVLARFEARLTDLEAPDGPERLRRAHLDRSATVGGEVRVDMSDGPVTGTAVDLALDGSLLVDSGDGPVAFRAGDVVHLRPA